MNKRQQMLQRMLRALLPVGILSRIIIGSLGISRAQIKAGTDHNFAKARVTAILSDYSDNTPFNGPQQVRAVLISGTWKGQEVELANSTRLNVGQLLYSGILISSLGAVMDVSVSVAAAIEEIHEKAPGTWTAYVAAVLLGCFIGAGNNLTPAIIATVFGRYDFSKALAVIMPIWNIVVAFATTVVGVPQSLTGSYVAAYIVLTVVAVIGFILVVTLDDRCIGREDA